MKSFTKQDVAESLRQRILSLQLSPSQLLDEVALANEYGMSRTPMREIIQRLSGEGYLEPEQNRGAKVAPMDFATMRHFFQAAPMVYAAAARLAAEHATPDHIERLKTVQSEIRAAVEAGDSPRAAIQNHHFHAFVGEMAASPYLMPSLNRLLIDHTRMSQVFYNPTTSTEAESVEQAVDHHDMMIEAFANHDTARAVELTKQHWDLSRNRIQTFVDPGPLPFELEEEAHAV